MSSNVLNIREEIDKFRESLASQLVQFNYFKEKKLPYTTTQKEFATCGEAQKNIEQLQNKIKELKVEQAALEASVASKKAKTAKLTKANEDLEKEIEEMKTSKSVELKSQCAALKTAIDMYQDNLGVKVKVIETVNVGDNTYYLMKLRFLLPIHCSVTFKETSTGGWEVIGTEPKLDDELQQKLNKTYSGAKDLPAMVCSLRNIFIKSMEK